jgi:two-component system, cell cycle response regulator
LQPARYGLNELEFSMPPGGHTTVIQRILERRAHKPPEHADGTTATLAVMMRVLEPPKVLIACHDDAVHRRFERRILPDVFEAEYVEPDLEALKRCGTGRFMAVFTDSLDFVRQVRVRPPPLSPFVLFVAELDDGTEREAGLLAGSDECVGRRVSDREFDARISAARRIAELEAVLRITLDENRRLSATDDLTRVGSRRFFGKHFPQEIKRAARYGRALSVILCDIDEFKKINDTLGHPAGDQVLQQFASRLKERLRQGIDWVARIGGEEFAVVLPEIGYQASLEVAHNLRQAIAQAPFKIGTLDVNVTASFGLCAMDGVREDDPRMAERMLKAADAALYRSKHDGRNRVTATAF